MEKLALVDSEPQSYSDWKSERQAYLDNRSVWQVMKDEVAFAKYNSDEGYYGLADDISKRQSSKIPIAGEGVVIFLTELTKWGKPISKLGWPLLLAYGIAEGAEQFFKFKTGIEYD